MSTESPALEMRHTLRFRHELDAAAAARSLRGRGFDVEGEMRIAGCRVFARAQPGLYEETRAARVLAWAAMEFRGRYTGSQVADQSPPD